MEREEERKKKEKEEKRYRELAMAAGSSRPIEMESYYDPKDEVETYGVRAAQTSADSAAIHTPMHESFWATLIASAAVGFLIGSILRAPTSSKRKKIRIYIDEQRILNNYRVFREATGIIVSKQAHTTIMNTLTSIIIDPHPGWQIQPRELQGVVNHFIDNLPNYLLQLAKDERVSQQITSFDILHWLTRNLATLCIIEKPSR